MDALLFHNFHPPDDVRVFTVPRDGIQRLDSDALVYDVRVGPDSVLRHYSWSSRWFEVNCSFSLTGDLIEEDGVIRWAYNCDIATPHVLVDGNAYNMDLQLDVLVSRDGLRHMVKDREHLTRAVKFDWVDPVEAAAAEQGLAHLLYLIEHRRFRALLEETCPFSSLRTSAVQPCPEHKRLAEAPVLHRVARRAHALLGFKGTGARVTPNDRRPG